MAGKHNFLLPNGYNSLEYISTMLFTAYRIFISASRKINTHTPMVFPTFAEKPQSVV